MKEAAQHSRVQLSHNGFISVVYILCICLKSLLLFIFVALGSCFSFLNLSSSFMFFCEEVCPLLLQLLNSLELLNYLQLLKSVDSEG